MYIYTQMYNNTIRPIMYFYVYTCGGYHIMVHSYVLYTDIIYQYVHTRVEQ